jgi:CRISPR-associated protein Cas2
MRHNYIVTYDIADEKRLRRVFKVCRDYGEHLQYSVFECDLDRREKADFEAQLKAVMHDDDDQVLFIDLGPSSQRGERTVTALGKTYIKFDAPCFIA